MAEIHIHRAHRLGLAAARAIAHQWAEQGEASFGLRCTYEEGEDGDCLRFQRTGLSGSLQVSADQFALDASLGFLLSGFQPRIEAEIAHKLDALLLPAPAGNAA